MKIVFMYVDGRSKKERAISYGTKAFKIALMFTLLALNTPLATESFKLGNLVKIIPPIPNAIP